MPDGASVARATPLLTGARRVAMVMLALGAEKSAPILEHFGEGEVKQLSLAMTSLGVVPREEIEAVLNEFEESIAVGQKVIGNHERTEEFLLRVLPRDRAEAIIDELRGRANRSVWGKLATIDPLVIATYLRGEHPQTTALILSNVGSDLAARILSGLPEDKAVDILNRMLKLRTVRREALNDVEEVLHAEFLSGLSSTTRRDAHEKIADVFNALDRQAERRLMEALEKANEEAAGRVKELMFTFEDLTQLGETNIQVLLRDVDRALLARALKGVPDAVRDVFAGNMSKRAAGMLIDDISALGPMKLKDVEAAQAQLVQHAKDKESKGEIVMSRGGGSGGDDLVV